jgi:hypothetical protein
MSRPRSRYQALLTIALSLGCGLLIVSSCDAVRTNLRWPKGAALQADTRALDRVLEKLARLEGTPLARRAQLLRAALPDCSTVEAHAESGQLSDLESALQCRREGSGLAALEQLRAERDLALTLPIAGGRAIATLSIHPSGNIEVEVQLPDAAGTGITGLALPGADAAGITQLSGLDTLIHARIRPRDGLNLSALVPPASQGDRLFRLKSELFSGLVLDGVWEIAVYLPEEGQSMPQAALALNFSHRATAVAAMEDFIRSLQDPWPVRRSFFQIGAAEGACLLDLKLMPDLAPCYVATEDALVVGWNSTSLRTALAPSTTERPGLGGSGGAIIHLERFAEADRILSRSLSIEHELLPRRYPWRRIIATGAPAESGFRLQLHFESGVGS